MDPLDLRTHPPRSCRVELDGLMLLPRTIDKIRALLPGGEPGGYFINGPIQGISGFLLQRLGITEGELGDAVRRATSEDDVAAWLRERTDSAQYPALNATLARIKPKHAENEELFRQIYVETLADHPELEYIVDIIDADDARAFRPRP